MEIVENPEEEEVGGCLILRVIYGGPGASRVAVVVENLPANAGHTRDASWEDLTWRRA